MAQGIGSGPLDTSEVLEGLTLIFGKEAVNDLRHVRHLIKKDPLNSAISWLLHWTVCDNIETLLWNKYYMELDHELSIVNLEKMSPQDGSVYLVEKGFHLINKPDIHVQRGASNYFIEIGTGVNEHNTFAGKAAEWAMTWRTDLPCHVLAASNLGEVKLSPDFPLNQEECEVAVADLVHRHAMVQNVFTYRNPRREKADEAELEWSDVTNRPMFALLREMSEKTNTRELRNIIVFFNENKDLPFNENAILNNCPNNPITFSTPPEMKLELVEEPHKTVKRKILDIEDDFILLEKRVNPNINDEGESEDWGLSNKELVIHFYKTLLAPNHNRRDILLQDAKHAVQCWMNGNNHWSVLSMNIQDKLGRGFKKRKENTTWKNPHHKPDQVSYSHDRSLYRIPTRSTSTRPLKVNPQEFQIRHRLATQYDTDEIKIPIVPESKAETPIDEISIECAKTLQEALTGTGYNRIIDKLQNFGTTILDQYSKTPETKFFISPIASRTILQDMGDHKIAKRRIYGIVIVGERHGKESSDQIEMIQIELYNPRLRDLNFRTRDPPYISTLGRTLSVTTPSYTLGHLVRFSNASIIMVRPLSISERINLKACNCREFDLSADRDKLILKEICKAIAQMTIKLMGQSYDCMLGGGLQLEHVSNLLRHTQLWQLFCKSGLWGHRNGIGKEIEAISGFNAHMGVFLMELKEHLADLAIKYPTSL